MLSASKQTKSQSGAVIGGLVVVMLAAIAIALPPSPIDIDSSRGGVGALESASLFSDGIAEQNAAAGFGYLALDLSRVSTANPEALWRQQLVLLSSRRIPIWAWVDASRCDAEFLQMVNDLPFAGIYVFGEDAATHVGQLRTMRPSRPAIAVAQVTGLGGDEVGGLDGDAVVGDPKTDAVMLSFEQYLASTAGQYAYPVLVADQLSAAQVETALNHATELAGKDGTASLLVARVPIG